MKTKFYQLHSKSLTKHKAHNLKELWDIMLAKGYEGLQVQSKTVFKKSESNPDVYHAIFSTPSVDRHGEVVIQNWQLKHFKNNPVYLDSHDYSSIEKIIGKVNKIKATDKGLEGDVEFAIKNPKGLLARDLVEGGFLSTSSVGFIPKKFDDKFEKILESELLEISAVSVPANPEALFSKDNKKKENKEVEVKAIDEEIEEPEVPEDEENKKEDKADEVTNVKIEKANDNLLYEIIKSEIDIRERALSRVYKATKLMCDELKVGNHIDLDNRLKEKSIVNKAIRELLDLKKALNK